MKTGILCFFSKRYSRPLYWPSTIFIERLRAVVVEGDLTADVDAELGGALDVVEDAGRLEEGLGGDAATVETGAAELELLDDGDLETELGGADGGDVAAGAAAEDDEVELVGCRCDVRHGPAGLLVSCWQSRPGPGAARHNGRPGPRT
jgi:hypothetical protein